MNLRNSGNFPWENTCGKMSEDLPPEISLLGPGIAEARSIPSEGRGLLPSQGQNVRCREQI